MHSMKWMPEYGYRINEYAAVQGSPATGWSVINMVTGLPQEATYTTFASARDAARRWCRPI